MFVRFHFSRSPLINGASCRAYACSGSTTSSSLKPIGWSNPAMARLRGRYAASPVSPLLAASLEAPGPRGMVPGTLGSPSRRPGPGAWLLPDFATEEPLVCHLPQAGSDRGHSWYTDRPRTGACAACAVAIFKIATQGVHWSDTGQTCIEARNILNAHLATEVWMRGGHLG